MYICKECGHIFEEGEQKTYVERHDEVDGFPKYFYRYGGRGISVYFEWINDFIAFDKYVSSLPHHNEPGYTIDRINNDGNYEPGNLRWATASEQAKNRGK